VPSIELRLYAGVVPIAGIDGKPAPEYGAVGEAGLRVRVRQSRLSVEASYRLERYEFPAASPTTVERFQQLGLRIGWDWR
jgi:hypothetical protein